MTAILDHYLQWNEAGTWYPSQLRVLAKRLQDKQENDMHEVSQRRHVEQHQEKTCNAVKNERKGALASLLRKSDTGVPSVHKAGIALREQMQQAAGLLATSPISRVQSR